MADRAPHAETPMTTPAQDTQRAEGAERVGMSVLCNKCERRKKPIGRDLSPAGGDWCHSWVCKSYYSDPKPDTLWPGEPEAPDV